MFSSDASLTEAQAELRQLYAKTANDGWLSE